MKALRAAVIGCGAMGRLHAQALSNSSIAHLVAVCDTDLARARALADAHKVAAYGSCSELLRDETLDVVTVATPNDRHATPVLEALKSGCHVFCEKPLASTTDDAAQMVLAARKAQCALAVNYNRRFGFGYRRAKQWLEEDKIGAVKQIVIQVADHTPPPRVQTCPAVMLSTLLVHHLDLMRFLGGEVHEVQCLGPAAPAGLIREMAVVLRNDSGWVGMISAHYRDGLSRTWEHALIHGERGQIAVVDVTRAATLMQSTPDQIEVAHPSTFGDGDAFRNTTVDHIADFLHAASEQAQPTVSGRDGWLGLHIVQAGLASLRLQQSVRVEEV